MNLKCSILLAPVDRLHWVLQQLNRLLLQVDHSSQFQNLRLLPKIDNLMKRIKLTIYVYVPQTFLQSRKPQMQLFHRL